MGRFRCLKDQTCIPLHKKCNGIKDCSDGWDEDKDMCSEYLMSHVMRKPDVCLCENKGADQLCSICTADQQLSFCYKDGTTPTYIQNFKLLVCICLCTYWFVSDMVGNPDDRFSHVTALIVMTKNT